MLQTQHIRAFSFRCQNSRQHAFYPVLGSASGSISAYQIPRKALV